MPPFSGIRSLSSGAEAPENPEKERPWNLQSRSYGLSVWLWNAFLMNWRQSSSARCFAKALVTWAQRWAAIRSKVG